MKRSKFLGGGIDGVLGKIFTKYTARALCDSRPALIVLENFPKKYTARVLAQDIMS
jgi:hypothetical protein